MNQQQWKVELNSIAMFSKVVTVYNIHVNDFREHSMLAADLYV